MGRAEDTSAMLAALHHAERIDQREAEALPRERELLQRIFDTVPLMMTIYEPDTKILRVNRAFERLIGWSTDDLTGVSLMEECYPDPAYRDEATAFMQACLPEWRDWRVRTRYGGEIESSWTNVRLSDSTQLGIGVDITERKRIERALIASQEEMKVAHRLKDEFLATLAHELRNPLSPLRNAVELLRMAGASSPTAMSSLAVLDRQLGVMVRLVDDLLDISRINTGKIELHRERVDLASILRSAIESSRTFFRVKAIDLIVEISPEPFFVDGDSVRLEQVFSNVLNNAGKFTPTGGKVLVSIERQGNQAGVRVRDWGIGIDANLLPRVFDMFVQADQPIDHTNRGLGIGLSLVKRLVDLHGGTVVASSDGVGQGSEFVVRLPLAGMDDSMLTAPHPTEPGLHAPPAQRSRVLVVDDNADAADTLAQLLGASGHEVYTCYSATTGIELAKSRQVDAIVMDLAMPGMDGYEAARRIRADPELGNVQLIALTGWGQEQARRESAEAGFDHHLIKPVDLSVLAEILTGRAPTPNRTRATPPSAQSR